MEHETIGRSGWVESYLKEQGLSIHDVDGYSVGEGVELAIDRWKVTGLENLTVSEAQNRVETNTESGFLEAKERFAELGDCKYHIVMYDDESARCYRVDDEQLRSVTGLVSIEEFGKWVFDHNDTKKVDKKVRADLPDFDNILRQNGTPWPSNLDGFWYDGRVRALIEYQTTKKARVVNHSNNRYFHQDYGRWDMLKRLAEGVHRPLVIIVWSPNDGDDDIKVKKVSRIQFEGDDRGLHYDSVEVLKRDGLVDHLEEIL